MKTKKLFLLLTFAFIAFIATGCFGDISNATKLTFVQTPQAIYYAVGSDDAMAAQQEVLENVIVKVDDNEYTLKDLRDLLGATVEGLNLTEEGTHTLVIKYEGVTLTYIYKVVTDLGSTLFAGGEGTEDYPYEISTPEQFRNMFTRVYGIAAPAKLTFGEGETFYTKHGYYENGWMEGTDAEGALYAEAQWKTYYQACFPFFTTGVHYKIVSDLDFEGEEFVPLGAFGGENFIPFTGTIDGNNKTIKNVTVSPVGDASSIFAGIYGSTIKNLNIDNFQCDVNSFTKYAGSLCSFAYGEKSHVENIRVTNSLIIAQRAGGIFAEGRAFIAQDCFVDENTTVAGIQYVGAFMAKSQEHRNFSYYLLTFKSKLDETVTLNTIENKTFIIKDFESEATLYSDSDDTVGSIVNKGSMGTHGYIDDDNETIGEDTSYPLVKKIVKVTEAPDGATTVYLGILLYSSLYTSSSNRAFIFDVNVYNQWPENVEEAFDPANPPTQAELMNDARFDTFNAILSDGNILFDNRIFVYDADGFVNIELMTLKSTSSKYRIFFKDGVVCGATKESPTT